MRLFSIVLWHHFAYMMISVALLGYGAAGTFVTLARPAAARSLRATFVAAAALFGVCAVGGFLLAQRVAFNPLELLWDRSAAAAPARRLRAAARSLLLRGDRHLPHVHALRRARSVDLRRRSRRCGCGVPRGPAPPSSRSRRPTALLLIGRARPRGGVAAPRCVLRPRGVALALLVARVALPLSSCRRLGPSPRRPNSRSSSARCRFAARASSPSARARSVSSPSSKARRCRSATRRV